MPYKFYKQKLSKVVQMSNRNIYLIDLNFGDKYNKTILFY